MLNMECDNMLKTLLGCKCVTTGSNRTLCIITMMFIHKFNIFNVDYLKTRIVLDYTHETVIFDTGQSVFCRATRDTT